MEVTATLRANARVFAGSTKRQAPDRLEMADVNAPVTGPLTNRVPVDPANEKATGIRAEDFARNWIDQLGADQVVNGDDVAGRSGVAAFIADWPKQADGTTLDLDKAPFRLLAIINRVDLRNNDFLGVERIGGGGAGEARFVFCGTKPDKSAIQFTVIFEYQIKRDGPDAVREWGAAVVRPADARAGLRRVQDRTRQADGRIRRGGQ